MDKHKSSIMLSKEDEKYYLRLQQLRDPFIKPIVEFLARKKVKPDTLSYLGLAMMVPFVYFFSFNPWVAYFFLIFALIFDLLDGSLARFLKVDSPKGDFLEHAIDYLVFVVVFMTVLFFSLMSPFWAALLLVNYAVMQSFVIFARLRRINIFPILRAKYFFYLVILVWLIGAWNFFDPFLVLFTVYFAISNLFLFLRIRWSLL